MRAVAIALASAVLSLLSQYVAGQQNEKKDEQREEKKEEEEKTTNLRIHVLDKESRKPVEGAPVNVRTEDNAFNEDSSTTDDGWVKLLGVPRGRVKVLITATGWGTFGQWFDLSGDEQSLEIELTAEPGGPGGGGLPPRS